MCVPLAVFCQVENKILSCEWLILCVTLTNFRQSDNKLLSCVLYILYRPPGGLRISPPVREVAPLAKNGRKTTKYRTAFARASTNESQASCPSWSLEWDEKSDDSSKIRKLPSPVFGNRVKHRESRLTLF